MSALDSLTYCINAGLQRDPETIARLQKYQDKTLALHFQPMEFTLYFSGAPAGIELSLEKPMQIDATLSGTPWQFLRMITTDPHAQKKLLTEEMQFTGDVLFANEWQQIFQSLDLDWDGALATILPDTAVHYISQSVKQLGQFIQARKQSTQTYMTELLQEECQLSPPREEVVDFFNDVTDLENRSQSIRSPPQQARPLPSTGARMIKRIRQLSRLLHINFVLARHGLDNVILNLHLFRPFRFLVWLNPWNWIRREPFNRAIALRESLENLGPIFVKFGQALSMRQDLIPDDIADELTKLQDSVAPFSSDLAVAVIEKTYGKPLSALFASFDRTPLASASIAQVHAATLFDGRNVVVKVVRPGIEKIIERDIELLYSLANLAMRYWGDAPRFHPLDVVKEFEQTLQDELDLLHEAANATQLRRHFTNSPMLYVPEIIWPYTHSNVLVMERIYGIPILDLPALRAAGIDIKKLAERGVEIFFTQVFRDSFFHADMHPGNIFVSYDNPSDPQYICVDFGIMGSLDHKDKQYLAENFHAFFQRDYNRVAELHVESGWVSPNTRITDFERAIRTVCEPIFERPLAEISCAQMLLKLFQIGRRFNMEVQPQLLLLQKTLFAIEGLGRILYPELDLWSTAKPFLERWITEQIGPKAFLNRLKNQLPYWSEQLPLLPSLIYDTLQAKKQIAQQQQYHQDRIDIVTQTRDDIKQLRKQTIGLTLGAVGILEYGAITFFAIEAPVLLQMSLVFMVTGLLTWIIGPRKLRKLQ